MAVASKTFRTRMLLTTAAAALAATLPNAAHAQLVTSGDLVGAQDSAGNPGQLIVTDTNATTTDLEVQAAVVVAEWTDFNVDSGDTVNVTIDAGLGLTEATLFNRVIGGNPSNINGTINAADINFWLVNQNGIMFGNDTAITAQSFFATTVNVENQDIFDFYEGTDLFGNGSNTLNFAGMSSNAIQSTGTASFITDGTLAFVSQQLDLTGTFNAQTGRAAFIAASDVDVSFTPGSPLAYTVNAGTTIAAQSIDGTVTGSAVEFAMLTDVGVVGALLDIDASVTATTAIATDRGISLLASGPSSVTVEIGGAFASTGEVVLNSNGDLTATSSIDGSALDLDASGAIDTADLSGTVGNIDLNAGTTITAGVVDSAGGGGVILTAPGNITTTSIVSNEPGALNGFIDAQSTGGGALDLGVLSTDGTIDLDTSGLVTTSTITSLGNLNIGGTTAPSTVIFTGNVSVDTIDIDATGAVTGLDIDTTEGDLNITANTISAGAVSSTRGDVILSATGNITTTSITSNELLGIGGAVDVDSTGGGTLDLGTVTGDGAIVIDTAGSITMDDANAGGALTVGGTVAPSSLAINGVASGTTVDLTSTGTAQLQTVTTTAGAINVAATAITSGADLDFDSATDITLGADATGDSITIDAPGAVATQALTATSGDVIIGGTTTLLSLSAVGTITGEAVDITAVTIDVDNVDATDGDADFSGTVVTIGDITSTRGDVTIGSNTTITTGNITATRVMGTGGRIDIDSTGGGDISLGNLTASRRLSIDTLGVLSHGAIDAGQVRIGQDQAPSLILPTGPQTGESFDINVAFDYVADNITATNGGISIVAPSIETGDLTTTGGDVALNSPGAITTGNIDSNQNGAMVGGAIDIDSTSGGAVNLGSLDAEGQIDLDTFGTLAIGAVDAQGALIIGALNLPSTTTFNGNIRAGSFAFSTTDPFTVDEVETTDGTLSITAASIVSNSLTATGATGDVILISGSLVDVGTVSSANGIVDIDSTGMGDITLDTVTSSTDDIFIDTAGGAVTIGNITAGNLIRIGETLAPSMITFTGDITAATFIFNTAAAFNAGSVTATVGDIDIDAPSISLTDVASTGMGNVALTATGAVTTTSVTSAGSVDIDSTVSGDISLGAVSATGGNVDVMGTAAITTASIDSTTGAITVKSSGGGDLTLGAVNAAAGIMLDTNGALATEAINADSDGDLSGALIIGSMNQPNGVRFTGDVSGASVTIRSAGAVVALDATDTNETNITATNGLIDIDGTSLRAADVAATGNIELDAAGTIAVASAMAGGSLSIGSVTPPSQIDVAGTSSGTIVSIEALGAINLANVSATAGNVLVDATGGGLITGAVTASNLGSSVTLRASGATSDIATGTVRSNGGDILISAGRDMTTDEVSTALMGSPTLATLGLHAGGSISSSTVAAGEDVLIQAGSDLTSGQITAGDDVRISVGGDVGDGLDVIADATGMDLRSVSFAGAAGASSLVFAAETAAGSNVDIDSTGGGTLDLGIVSADNNVALDTSGALSTGAITADTDGNLTGSVIIGSAASPNAVRFTGDVSGASVTVRSTGAIVALDATDTNETNVTATNGLVDIDGTSLRAADVAAMGGNASINTSGAITTASVMSTGAVDIDSTTSGDVALGTVSGDTGVAITGTAGVTTTSITSSAGEVDVDSTGGAIDLGTVSGDSGVAITGTAEITTTSIAALNGTIDVDSTNGDLTLGDLTSGLDSNLDTSGAVVTGTVIATGAFQVGQAGDVASADFQGAIEGSSVTVDATGAITSTSVEATGGNLTIRAASIVGTDYSASGDLTLDGAGGVSLQNAIADSEANNAGALAIGTNIAPSQVSIGSNASGASIAIISDGGSIAVGSNSATDALTATNGGITLDAMNPATAGDGINVQAQVSATGGEVSLQSGGPIEVAGDIDANALGGIGGAIDVQSTGAGQLTLEGLFAENGILIDTAGGITVNGTIDSDADTDNVGDLLIGSRIASTVDVDLVNPVIAPNISITTDGAIVTSVDITATNGSIDLNADSISSGALTATGDITLEAPGNVSIASAVADSDNASGGEVSIGVDEVAASISIGSGDPSSIDFTGGSSLGSFVGGEVSGTDVTLVSNGFVATGDVSATPGNVDISASGGDIRVGNVASGDLAIEASGNVRVDGDIDASGEAVLQANDIALAGATNVAGPGLTLRANSGRDVLIGDAMGDPEAQGDFHISDAELDGIVTGNLIIDAGAGNIDIATVSFTDQAGSDQVSIVNRGMGTVIEIEGNITAAGAGRVFQIGENGVSLADVTGDIIVKIEKSTIDLGAATLDLQATDIVFGSSQLLLELDAQLNASADVIAFTFVGNSGSTLFNPDAALVSARAANPVYLRAGNLIVTYGETALFQNTLPLAEGELDFAGVVLGDEIAGNGSLTLRPTDLDNAFNMFGVINDLDGEAVAFAPDPVLVIDGQISVFGSRINGCLIRSGADCITTVVDTTIIQVPREAVSLLTADPDVFLPFDPLVGTNNEGLFSGAAAGPGEDCERDDDGVCR